MGKHKDIQERTYNFALRIVKMCQALQQDAVSRVLVNQVLRSGTSIGANVEEAQDAQSKPDFLSKMSIVLKESRETLFWLRLIRDSGEVSALKMDDIISECEQLRKIIASIVITSKNASS